MRPVRTLLDTFKFYQDELAGLALGLALAISGLITILVPNHIFVLILEISILYFFINALYLLWQAFVHRRRSDLLYGFLSLFFTFMLTRYTMLPEWIIRVSFAVYALMSAAANAIQFVLDRLNSQKSQLRMFFFAMIYAIFGLVLLFLPEFPSDLLMSFFGAYFLVLGLSYILDALETMQPKRRYRWKRHVRVTLPPLLCAFMPQRALTAINRYLEQGLEVELDEKKSDEVPNLRIMVFCGPTGLQKVGHCCFSYEDIVYSYGNYDCPESGPGKVIGDGCYFNVPLEYYQGNMLWSENNSIFEFGIHLTPEQQARIEEQLQALKNNSYRWYCRMEREDGYFDFDKYKADYPSRLHYRTGAKFYKIKSGRFRYYWFLGDNCASFIDSILGTVGADILSMRGFITPGTYFDYLQREYAKAGSPVISRTIFPWSPSEKADKEKNGKLDA